ncbi:MAG: hypothetical protein AAFW75_12680 [Cyanobacteria bacterium J06636_16]
MLLQLLETEAIEGETLYQLLNQVQAAPTPLSADAPPLTPAHHS